MSQALYHQIAGRDFAGAGLGFVLAVRGAVGHIAGFLCLLNNKAESNRKRQRARTNNSEKHGKQNEKGEAQKKQRQDAKNNGSNGRSEQGRMWRAYLHSPVWG